MYHAASPFRLTVTLLLVAALPICCCNFRLVYGAGDGCHSGSTAAAVSVAETSAGADEPCCGSAADLTVDQTLMGSDDGDPGKVPVSPDGRCSCDKNKLAAGSIETPSIPSLAFIAPVAEIPAIWDAREHPAALASVNAGILRPATALLRMHCALTI
ncbi:MAG: hypothetical protein IT436_15040 [Phycisphaerales bacterium]|nr:hypothetical protein [Phycisphaerales bacterium]